MLIFGEHRRRIPELWDVDNALMAGIVQNQDAYMQSVAAQRPFFFDHITPLTEQCISRIRRAHRPPTPGGSWKAEDADYVILGQGSMVVQAEAVADYLRETRKLKVGVVNLTMFRPFPGGLIARSPAWAARAWRSWNAPTSRWPKTCR
jgi:pyruvate-ferredoxin/flavodoxin oxidoreductase